MKKILGYITLTITLFYQGYCFADDKFGGAREVMDGLKGDDQTADITIQGYVAKALNYIYLIAVIWGIYGGFLILTSGGEEEKVEKGKNIIKEALIGIMIIFLANSIVKFVIHNILS